MPKLSLMNSNEEVLIDEKDCVFCNKWKWWRTKDGYVVRREKKVTISLHREMMDLETHDKRIVHHKDENRFNNCRNNLQVMSVGEHIKHHKTGNNYGLIGVRHPLHGKPKTEKYKKIMSEKMKMRWNDPKKRRLLIESFNGRRNGMLGKRHTEETKKKIAAKRTGVYCGEKHPRAKLTWPLVNNIRQAYLRGELDIGNVSKKYRVKPEAIYKIIHNRTWVSNYV